MHKWLKKYFIKKKASIKSQKSKKLKLTFTVEELIEFSFSNDVFEQLHTAWIKSGKETALVPSLDRIDSTGGYSLDNVQWMTWAANKEKSRYECFKRPVTVVNQYGDKTPRSYTTLANASKAEGTSTQTIRRAIHSGKASKGKFYTEPSS